jgi:hypothetical protein
VSQRSTLLSVAASLMVALAAPAAFANLPIDEKKEEVKDDRKGGNAADKATAKPATSKPSNGNQSGLSPAAYDDMAEFWGLFLASGTPIVGALEAARNDPDLMVDPPSLQLTRPTDGPAESVLDQIDESLAPPVLVGLPGSEASSATGSGNTVGTTTTPAPAPAAGETPTPPSESILDFIDTAPAPQPAVSTMQEASKPAVDQASKPAVVKSPPP